jgi:hypothetical protein
MTVCSRPRLQGGHRTLHSRAARAFLWLAESRETDPSAPEGNFHRGRETTSCTIQACVQNDTRTRSILFTLL